MDIRWAAIAFVVLSLAAGPASARLGETPGQCMERYGAPVGVNALANSMEFRTSDYYILVTFHDGVADSIAFWKLADDSPGGVQWLSMKEIKAFLRANGQGAEWWPGFPSNGRTAYSEGNGVDPWYTLGPAQLAAFYHYSVGAQHLSIKTIDHIRRKQAAEWAAIQAKARQKAVDPEVQTKADVPGGK